jgi:allophanate hydrolase subunit 1
VPTYRSLLINDDPLQIDRDALIGIAHKAAATSAERVAEVVTWILPCCYDEISAEWSPSG